MSILGIDVGTKRIGIAVSDELNLMAHPVGTVAAEPKETLLSRLEEIVNEKQVREIVVGMPVNMNGTRGPKAEQADEFIKWLKHELRLPVHSWDERLTTAQGTKMLIDQDFSRKQRRRVIDSLAAQILLQSYLDSKH